MKPVRPSIFADAEPRGHGRTPRVQLMLNERNKYLVAAAAFFPGLSDHEVARLLRKKLSIYRAGPFRRERADLTCPKQHKGKLLEALWCCLKSFDAIPATRSIRRVLGATRGPKSLR
jgi:hypothetical protein